MRRSTTSLWLLCALSLGSPTEARAQEVKTAAGAAPDAAALYAKLLAERRLSAPPAEEVEELEQELAHAQELLVAGKKQAATEILLEIVEGPRFRRFSDLDAFHTAELMTASALIEAHALITAQRILDRLLALGPAHAAFAPAYRRAVDVALLALDLDARLAHLRTFGSKDLPQAPANELAYLEARAHYDRGALEPARTRLGQITKKSRFYPNAQYLLGAIAAKERNYKEAEARFCAVTGMEKDHALSFYVDQRFYPVRDLSHLALGRVAHETARANDAFYYYFQIPNDSDRVAEALNEAAWASYEGGDYDAALDSLDQLRARYPRSPYSAEAAVLRGYVHLSRCEFADAERELTRFERAFTPVLREIRLALGSPSRRADLRRDLIARHESIERIQLGNGQGEVDPDNLLLALIRDEPELFRLHAEIQSLDAELAYSSRLPATLEALATRVQGQDLPKARAADQGDELAAFEAELDTARRAAAAMALDLGELRKAGGKASELRALADTRRALDAELAALERELLAARIAREKTAPAPAATELSALLTQDTAYIEALRSQGAALRAALVAETDKALLEALDDTAQRLAAELRRARIGRIDAVMGSKRQVELQVESLAAGRFPPELADVLRMQSLLRDDEEYWPFEGENWPDEFVERYTEEEE